MTSLEEALASIRAEQARTKKLLELGEPPAPEDVVVPEAPKAPSGIRGTLDKLRKRKQALDDL